MIAQPPGPEDRLDSWKEIACYLKRGVRTVQRWERARGLPVYRLGHDRLGSVYAYRAELDAWWQTTSQVAESDPPSPVPALPRRRYRLLWIAAGLIILLGTGYLARRRPSQQTSRSLAPLDPVPLTSEPGGAEGSTFSPDGNRVAYAWDGPSQNNYDIYVRKIGTDLPIRLTSAPEPDLFPSWSPDGSRIAFLRATKNETAQLILIPASGGSEHIVTDLGHHLGRLSWSPDGKWITATSGWDKEPSIYAIDVESGLGSRLTWAPPEGDGDLDPAVAPDGSGIVFSRDIENMPALFRLRLTRQFTPSGNPSRLTNSNAWEGMPAFTANSRAIIYSSGVIEENPGLWLLPLYPFPGKPRLLLRSGNRDFEPAVSPQHDRLAFTSSRNLRTSVWELDLTPDVQPKGEPHRLIWSTHNDYNAQYSPNGRRIVFHSIRSGTSEIWVSDGKGQHAERFTTLKAPVTGAPRWSPDGKWITFDSNALGQFEVYRAPSSGGNPEQLTHHPGVDGVASWSRDGRSIYFVSNRSGSYQIWKMAANGSNPRQLTRHGGYLALESPDGRWVYYSKQQKVSPLYRIPAEGGEETEVLPAVDEFHFAVLPKGVLFSKSAHLIEYLNFTTKKVLPFLKVAKPLRCGLSVSTDQRHLLFSQVEHDGSELMLVENFQPAF